MLFLGRIIQALCLLLVMAVAMTPFPVPAADSAQPAAGEQANAGATQTPQTNEDIRQWYNDQVSVIPALNEQWRQDGLSAEERARRAHDIRHAARLKARDFMPNKQDVADLQARDQEKYGNPNGPTFSQLVQANRDKGLTGDAVYNEIITSASRTNKDYNNRYGVKPPSQAP